MSKKFQLCLLVIIAAGIVLRIASFSWNTIVHGDVGQYTVAADAMAHRGDFLLSTDFNKDHFYSLQKTGGRFLEHNPMWPSAGALIIKLLSTSGYGALKVLSVASGLALLYFVYLFGCRLGGLCVGMLALALSAFSYVLIDFSGNGAFYIFQALLYIVFLLVMMDVERTSNQILAGIVMGFGVLLNQQILILLFAYIAYWIVLAHGNYRMALHPILIGIIMTMLFYMPWGLRNYFLFGTPFAMVDTAYVWSKLGVSRNVVNHVISFRITGRTLIDLIKQIFGFWLPHNLYFLNRKFFILAPVSYIFAILAFVQLWFKDSYDKLRCLVPLFLVLGFHIILSAAWPIAKFRYVVPAMPLIFIAGSYFMIYMIEEGRMRKIAVASSVVGIMIFSIMTYYSTSTHTYYYDGSITADNFGQNGEVEFIKSTRISEGD